MGESVVWLGSRVAQTASSTSRGKRCPPARAIVSCHEVQSHEVQHLTCHHLMHAKRHGARISDGCLLRLPPER